MMSTVISNTNKPFHQITAKKKIIIIYVVLFISDKEMFENTQMGNQKL
jgi:hypothetical protein